jgi:hypothetical protein
MDTVSTPKTKKGREEQQAGWPEAMVMLDGLSVKAANQDRRHAPLAVALG